MKFKLLTLTALLSLSFLASANQHYFNKLDADNNGSINVEEFKQQSKGWMDKKGIKDENKRAKYNENGFNKIDANKDGKVTFQEYDTFRKNKKNKKNKS
jgi:Ca2+-binding EF-hand superfamily protein